MSLTARRSFASLDTNGAISNICTLYCLLCVFYSVSVYSANRIHPFLPPNHTLSNVNHIQIPIAPVGNPSRNSGIRSLHSGIICCIRYYRQAIGTHPSRHPREMYCTTARCSLLPSTRSPCTEARTGVVNHSHGSFPGKGDPTTKESTWLGCMHAPHGYVWQREGGVSSLNPYTLDVGFRILSENA